MTLWEMKEDEFNRGREEGIEVGGENMAVKLIPKLMELGVSLEEACEKAEITVERYKELISS